MAGEKLVTLNLPEAQIATKIDTSNLPNIEKTLTLIVTWVRDELANFGGDLNLESTVEIAVKISSVCVCFY